MAPTWVTPGLFLKAWLQPIVLEDNIVVFWCNYLAIEEKLTENCYNTQYYSLLR